MAMTCFGKESYLADGNWECMSKDSLKHKASIISISSNGEHCDIGRSMPGVDSPSDDEVHIAYTSLSCTFA
jgi:hypothetical protein